MAQEIKNKIIVLEPCTKTVEDLLKTISDRKQAELIRVSIPEEAVQLVRQFQPCMLVLCIQENNELPQRVNLLKALESSIKYGQLKTLFVSKVKNKQIGTLITSLGVTDFIEDPVPLRTLQFKSNLQLKAVETIRKQLEMKKASQEKIVFKKNGQKEETEGSGDPKAKPVPALELAEDSFLFKNSGVKKTGKKMVVELEGPDPASGEWVSHEDKGNTQAAWRWVPEEEKDSPEAKRGDGWVHSGDKPQFQEASQKWQMASEKPDLSYQKEGKKVAKKISVNAAGEVTVAADSPKAEANIKKAKAAGKRAKERKAEQKALAAEKEKAAQEASRAAAGPKKENSPEANPSLAKESPAEKESEKPSPLPLNKAERDAESRKETKATAAEPASSVVDLKEHREQKEAKKAKEPALSPLEFLKKKKEKLAKENPAAAEEEKKPEAISPETEAPKAQASKTRALAEESPEAEAPAAQGKKKSREALDRLRAKLGEIPESATEAEDEAPSVRASEEKEEKVEPSPLVEKEEEAPAEASGPVLIGEKKAKKAKKDSLPGLVGINAKERKKKVLQEVQAMLAEPLPKALPVAEEKRLREKFGLEDDPEVTPEALARKERLEKVKALKESLLDFERQEAEEEREKNTHDLSQEESENTWSQKLHGEEKSVSRRAFDSDLPEEAEDEESGRLALQKKKNSRQSAEKEDSYLYLPESELQPAGNAWEKAEEHQVYLSGEIRYRGFAKMQDLLPLWIYQGGEKPELLDKTKQWRFLGSLPFAAKTVKEIPADVREFLLGLKSGAEQENKPASDEKGEAAAEEIFESEAPAKKAQEGPDLNALYNSFEKDAKALRESTSPEEKEAGPVTQADTLEEIFEKKGKGAEASLAETLSEKVKSPAIEKFLERRKKKEKSEATVSVQKAEPTNPYLGVFVALSNSFGPTKDGQRSVSRVLKSIEFSFGRCVCAILGPQEADGLSQVQVGSAGMPERIHPAGARPIRKSGEEEILGYLLISPTEGRSAFTEREEEVIAKVVASIWPTLARGSERKIA